MRTNIVVDDQLMKQAMKLSGLDTKKAVVEESLKLFVEMQKKKIPSEWLRNRRQKASNRSASTYDRLLGLAGAISDSDADEMLRVIYEDRSARWDEKP